MRKKEKNAAKGFFNGFKEFITKGNVIDLAVGVVIGAAFGKIVTSLVNDIIMPPIGVLINGVDFKDLVITLKQAQEATATAAAIPAITINYGNFIMSIIEFVLIAFSIYAVLTLVIRRRQFIEKLEAEQKAIEEANKPKEEVVVEVSEEILLLREINENLKKQKE